MYQQGPTCCHNFVTGTPSYHSKVNPVGKLDSEKLADIVLLYIYNKAIPASLLESYYFKPTTGPMKLSWVSYELSSS